MFRLNFIDDCIRIIVVAALILVQSNEASSLCQSKPYVDNGLLGDGVFTCSKGSYLIGSGVFKCLEDGSWSVHGECRKNRFHPKLIIAVIKNDFERINTLLSTEHADIDGQRPGDRRTALMIAAAAGKNEMVRFLLARGANVDLQDAINSNALITAIFNNHTETARILVEEGKADVNFSEKFSRTALSWAVRNNLRETVRLLIANKADVNACDWWQRNILMIANFRNHSEVTRILVEEGRADVNVATKDGETALMLAAENGNLANVRLLVKNGADVNRQTRFNATALMKAVWLNHIEIAHFLIEDARAALNLKSVDGKTALIMASNRGHVGTVRLLLRSGADVNLSDNERDSPLMFAIAMNQTETAKILINEGKANVNASNINGSTPLTLAAENGLTEIVRLLIDKKAQVNAQDIWGWSALMAAASRNRTEIARILVKEGGADVNLAKEDGQTALILATENGLFELVRLLVKFGANVDHQSMWKNTALIRAVYAGHTEIAKFLIEHAGADVNLKNFQNSSPLTLASFKGNVELVRLLLRHGADVDSKDIDLENSVLIAVRNDQPLIARILIEQGESDLNVRNNDGDTALHWAARNNFTELLPLLLKYGADVNAQNTAFVTPMMIAVYENNFRFAELLAASRVAELNLGDADGDTALHMAANLGRVDFVKLLLENGASLPVHNGVGVTAYDVATPLVQDFLRSFIVE